MPPALDQLINGHLYDFSSIELTVGPRVLTRITALNYEHGVDQGLLRGTSPFVMGSTRGQYDANGSMTMYLEEWDLLTSSLLALPEPGGFMDKRFPVVATYAEPVSQRLLVDTLVGARILRARRGYAAGADALVVDCDLHILKVLENGKPALLDNNLLP